MVLAVGALLRSVRVVLQSVKIVMVFGVRRVMTCYIPWLFHLFTRCVMLQDSGVIPSNAVLVLVRVCVRLGLVCVEF